MITSRKYKKHWVAYLRRSCSLLNEHIRKRQDLILNYAYDTANNTSNNKEPIVPEQAEG